jgi:hypothetical protein
MNTLKEVFNDFTKNLECDLLTKQQKVDLYDLITRVEKFDKVLQNYPQVFKQGKYRTITEKLQDIIREMDMLNDQNKLSSLTVIELQDLFNLTTLMEKIHKQLRDKEREHMWK